MITIIAIILVIIGVGLLIWNKNRYAPQLENPQSTPKLTQTSMNLQTSSIIQEKEQFVFEKNGESHVSKDGLTIIFNYKINKRLHKGPEITSYFFTFSFNGEKKDFYFSKQNLSIQWSGYTILKENESPLTLSVQKN